MVTTISACLTASAALAALCAPFATAAVTAASERSKASTWCCALHRLAAIGPPMLPRPMKAIFAMAFSLVELQVVSDRLEMRVDHLARDLGDGRRIPLRLLVLVDQQCPHALEEIVVGPHAGLAHAVLDGHRILERPVGAAPHLLER